MAPAVEISLIKIRNKNIETRNKSEIQIFKFPKECLWTEILLFWIYNFGYLKLFRPPAICRAGISCFGFRYLHVIRSIALLK